MHTIESQSAINGNQLQEQEYDVVIMGAGFAGNCQARHLLLNIPNIKIALVDPRSEERTDKDLKLGESMIEVAALLVCKELGLYEYMIENHPPKAGLNFHWPKDPEKTTSTDDYYHIWINRQPPIATFHIHRSKFEQDLLKMNRDMGAVFYNGRVVDVDLTPGDALKTVKIKGNDLDIEIKAKHVVDAAGRKFIIGKKTDNILFGPENLLGVNTGTAFLRVKNIDRTIFHSGYDPTGSSVSHYYCTNHWFGHGHWLWMIPIDTDPLELSIGIIQHHDVIPANSINTLDKFYAFLKENHNVLYQLIMSGENVDFHYLPRIAHTSKTMFSEDNWYVLGDAACIFDAFYSYGTTMIAHAIESVTEIIRAKLAGEKDAEEKRKAYNDFQLTYTYSVNQLYRHHSKQLGHASVMSWRIYFEYMWWFGMLIPLYVGKWHLDLKFIPTFLKPFKISIGANGIFTNVYEHLNRLVERNANIGLMDGVRADQLIWGYYAYKHFDDFLENTKLEPKRCNVFGSMKQAFFYIAVWYVTFLWKGFGLREVLNPRNLYHLFRMLGLSVQCALGELIFHLQNIGVPANSGVAKMRKEFKSYRYQGILQPWANEKAEQLNQEDTLKVPVL
ncbi:tryptophan 7-halogenase [Aetokthonos hydrillicola Thurmond2011]|jgi:flavin-dependent dehydrogenase|uniref:Tryptophan 7-halogenase n=2 Tax=Aetokthonos TaxID=1550243 RepID=A0AAP5MBG6_9CYAN|nr:tryptophan 7-halogenase [Aetokthonos hydrillicola]MBO3462730.1 tryptophan halogenase [Aetokthonos hydrillicola CCALA 1050]MBW4585736.1 tryptophan 7-halogenase [Aetokthonos hydrillicola CCALA 1050]MDR9899240.1 tryptophan 7-halogenase [Aetokthonos hydrillicola Thurmond2011]